MKKTDQLLNAAICKLAQIWLNRRLKEITNILNQGGNYNMKVTTSLAGFNFDMKLNDVNKTYSKDGLIESTTATEIVNCKMGLTDNKTEVEMDKDEFQILHDNILKDVDSFRDKVVTPIIGLFDKYLGRGFDTLVAQFQEKAAAQAAVVADVEKSMEERARDAVKAEMG